MVQELAYQIAYQLAPDKLGVETWQEFVHKLGNIYFYQENYQEALKLYNEVSQYNPYLWRPYHNMGVIHLYSTQTDLIDYDRAIELFTQALKNHPEYDRESSVSYSGLALAYFFKAAEPARISHFHKLVIVSDSTSLSLFLLFVSILQNNFLLLEAEKLINKAIRIDNSYASFHWNLGLIEFAQGYLKKAQQSWITAQENLNIRIKAQENLHVGKLKCGTKDKFKNNLLHCLCSYLVRKLNCLYNYLLQRLNCIYNYLLRKLKCETKDKFKNDLKNCIYDYSITLISERDIETIKKRLSELLKSKDAEKYLPQQKIFIKMIIRDLIMLNKMAKKPQLNQLINLLQSSISPDFIDKE